MIVRFLSGETVTMDIDKSNTVATLKKEIQSVTQNLEYRISLLIDGTILDDDKTIDFYRPYIIYEITCRHYQYNFHNSRENDWTAR